jgi:hypothetical protein
MKTAILSIVLLLCISFTAGAQANKQLQANHLEITGYNGSRMAIQNRLDSRYQSVKGSPYLPESWMDGRILVVGDTVGAEYKLRFNVYENEMQFIENADTLVITNPEKIDALWLGDRRFQYLAYTSGEFEKMTYFEVLVPGKIKLLVRHSCRIEVGSPDVTPYSSGVVDDRFVWEKSYYFQTIEMDSARDLPNSKGAFLDVKEFSSPDVREFMKSRKIKLRNEQDLITLFNWINTLPQK